MTSISLDNESIEILGHLGADVISSFNMMDQFNFHPFTRRNYVRTVFAFIEGAGVIMRDALLRLPEASSLTPEKRCILRDEKYEIEKNGKPIGREARYPFLNLLAATLRCWAELNGWDEERITRSIFGVEGWNRFQRTLDIRNRLTHPKMNKSIEVVLLQPEMEKRHIRVKVELGRSFSHAEASEELYACREGRHPAASPDRPCPRL